MKNSGEISAFFKQANKKNNKINSFINKSENRKSHSINIENLGPITQRSIANLKCISGKGIMYN